MRYTAHDPDDGDDDPDFPDAADTDDGDGDEDNDLLDPCPNCRRLMYADAEQCPHCGEYVTPAPAGRQATWVLVTAAVCLVVMLLYLFR